MVINYESAASSSNGEERDSAWKVKRIGGDCGEQTSGVARKKIVHSRNHR
jgi:hypothetical protein